MTDAVKRNKRIAMVVYNSISHDARVLKEAESLFLSGYAVKIFGIQDNNNAIANEILSSGVEVERVNWKSEFYKRIITHCFSLGIFISLSTILINYIAVYYVGINLTVSDFLITLAEEVNIISSINIFTLASIFILLIVMLSLIKMIVKNKRLILKDATNNPNRKNRNFPKIRTASLISRYFSSLKNQIISILKRLTSMSIIKDCIYPDVVKYNPYVIHCHDLNALPLGVKIKKKLEVKLVYDSHEIYEEQGSFRLLQRLLFRFIQYWHSGEVDVFITINDSIARLLSERYPALPRPVIVKNASKMPANPVYYDGRLHDAAGLERAQRILLYQGGFGQKRGLEILVESAVLLPEEWCLVMMGWGSLEEKLRDIAKQIDPESNKIRFLPRVPQSELPHWTSGASLGMIPYEKVNLNNWFCTPNKLWEYPAAGVPILASPFPELEKTILKNDIGWILPRVDFDSEDIARTIETIDERELKRKKNSCRKYIETDNWSIYESRLIDIYAGLVPNGELSA